MTTTPPTYLTFEDATAILGDLQNLAADAGTGLFEPEAWRDMVGRTADMYGALIYLEEFIATLHRTNQPTHQRQSFP